MMIGHSSTYGYELGDSRNPFRRAVCHLIVASWTCASAGCTMNADQFHARVSRDSRAMKEPLEGGDIHSLTKGIMRMTIPFELGTDMTNQTEEVVTQTYLQCSSQERRMIQLAMGFATTGSADLRYVPLMT